MIDIHAALGWRKRTSGRGGRVKTRVPIPAVVEFPQAVLRELRLLDPMLDGYILPTGEVWIVQLVPDRERIKAGREELAVIRADGDLPPVSSQLKALGFWLVASLPFHEGTSVGAAVTAAQRALYADEDQIKKTYRRNRAEIDGTAQIERMTRVMSDRIRSSARSDWSRTWRGKRTFSK